MQEPDYLRLVVLVRYNNYVSSHPQSAAVAKFNTMIVKLTNRLKIWHTPPQIRGHDGAVCSVCLDEVAESPDRFYCSCGAAYHKGCFHIDGTCLRCKAIKTVESGATSITWLPKFAEFAQTDDYPVAVSFHCMNCESVVKPGDIFCPSCGYHLDSLRGYLCPVCRVAVSDEDRFCRCCGTIFGKPESALIQCDSCRNLERAGMLVCRCGMSLEPSCPDCGSDIREDMFCSLCRISFEADSGSL